MGILRYKSTIPNDKPEWLLRLQLAISNIYSLRGIEDTEEEWQKLKDFVDWFVHKLYIRKDITVRSEIGTDLISEDGQRQLLIKRNGKLIQTYYIQK
ncbi:hypothetical protein [Prevotella multiformis]|jgi:hypothetical protein|uniref:Uncharacterized protein n=1 Tax=Prevotella multiformis DSM 16608 TaxID=888743 RepID=F0FB71_9BACT|nr:hypothetical protein [Prevotella multiformis]EGC18639.1 hypothetical protein HMPREF9141_2838 [Prevotella multiformis DSM 16608]